MSRTHWIIALVLIVPLAGTAATRDEQPRPNIVHDTPIHHGADTGFDKAERDTVYLLGGPGRLDGAFQDASGNPDWQGWTHADISQAPLVDHWQVSERLAIEGSYSMWCGELFDGSPGYGNDWTQNLTFVWPLPDAPGPVSVAWSGLLDFDTEPGYDYIYLQAWQGTSWANLTIWDGRGSVDIDELVALDPADWDGEEGPAIALRVRLLSDDIYSDEDGLWETNGAARVDLLEVTIDDVLVDSEDFEDQVSDHWQPGFDAGVGDFTQIWTGLQDMDPCTSNWTPQVAFIDDGVVVPGTGGTPCITWCYGPGGYVVNHSGGMSGISNHELKNATFSPVLEIPVGYEGVDASFSVYLHEELGDISEWPGIFFVWYVRATDSADPADIEAAPWVSRNFLYYGGPSYRRFEEDVTNLLPAGARWCQVQLGVWDYWSWGWGWGDDGTPAPYIDDVAVRCWSVQGPALSAVESHLAQDTFPTIGFIDHANLAANSCRFDMALGFRPSNVPGDSLVVDIAAVRAGSHLLGSPLMHVVMKPNPVFDAVRTLPPNFSDTGEHLRGNVEGEQVVGSETHWSFDLPDEGFFYPGDEIRYFFEARDWGDGDEGISLLPADTTGITRFVSGDAIDTDYPEAFTVHALPAISEVSEHGYRQPRVLLWFDQNKDSNLRTWREALHECNYDDDPTDFSNTSYDIYRTRVPDAGLGNGLGGRATAALIAEYDNILYDCGDLTHFTLCEADPDGDLSPDIQLLNEWLTTTYEASLWLCGADLANDLARGGAPAMTFLGGTIGAELVADDVRPYISDQVTPHVSQILGEGFQFVLETWVAYGGCQPLRNFDAVLPTGGAVMAAEYQDPAGNTGVYEYAAALYKVDQNYNTRVFYMPLAFADLYSSQSWTPPPGGPFNARSVLLDQWLPHPVIGAVDDIDLPRQFAVSAYPNPFNPRVTIALDLPRAADATVRIYDLRGALVRTQKAEGLPAGRTELVWLGEDDQGAAVASGVYFYRVEAAGNSHQGKLTLVR